MGKFGTFVAFLFVAMLAAGAFGSIHDQISYTVSSEYFTKFKFIQFGLLEAAAPERLRAAKVGFMASWWMGIPLGLLTGLAGFIHPSATQMRRALLLSLPVIMATTMIVALGGLVYGLSHTENLRLEDYAAWFVPQGLENPRSFICAGYMHNAAYLGGAVAVPTAWLFHLLYRRHAARAA